MRHKISILFIIPAMLSMSKAETNVVADIDIDSLACEESDSLINIEERLPAAEWTPNEDLT
ncbi:MAG: hypothetical protein K2O12_04925, partial [Muribaculaceae bacterium]|nr:hypothetical protein [Muribaculaceae bacterium]